LAEIDQQMSQMLSGPAVSMEPAVATETLGEVAPPTAELAQPVAAIDHSEPHPGTMEPKEALPQGDLHPPAP
jgi:sec-independent protein translocase protein TatB